jgi:hypothetical protein
MKIYLAHNHNDKDVVEPIAIQLRERYGEDSVFYDSWSIQPGDGIIDKMNEGLEKASVVFFFASKNSLSSQMVKVEWENAFFKAVSSSQTKFVTVKLDDSAVPSILLQNLYIDMFSRSYEVGLSDIIAVIENIPIFHEKFPEFHNLFGEIRLQPDNSYILLLKASRFVELDTKFFLLFAKGTDKSKLSFSNNLGMSSNGWNEIDDGSPMYMVDTRCNLIPGQPIRINVKSSDGTKPALVGVFKIKESDPITNRASFSSIPLSFISK